MTDTFTPEQRRKTMASVRGKDTRPEKAVRSMLHKLGYRFRLHRRDLPGKPDLVFSSRRKIIFVHGCFWHMHDCPRGRSAPAANAEFWQIKRRRTTDRDSKAIQALHEDGWEVYVVWECALKDVTALRKQLEAFLSREPTHRDGSLRATNIADNR
jgi:DNA mismatch endonuclease (patch repair protein)